MITRCAFSNCRQQFEVAVAEGNERWQRPMPAVCPSCSRPQSAKPIAILDYLEKLSAAYDLKSQGDYFAFNVIVEDIRSLHNIGSIFRTADGAGVSKLILCGISGVPPRKQIAKTSLGAEDTVPWTYCGNVVESIEVFKEKGVQIVGLERNDRSIECTEFVEKQMRQPLCLIVGNEVTGLSLQALSLCDAVCHLPMRGSKESLNVAVAFGIAAYMIAARINHSETL